MNVIGGNGLGKLTQAFGTLIQRLIPPKSGAITRLTTLVYTAQGTAHVITVLRSIGKTKLSSAASASQAVINLVADPGPTIPSANPIAANDYVAMQSDDGVTRLYKVSSVATLAITLTSNVVYAASAGRPVWFFGITTDTDPNTGEAHPTLRGVASQTTTYTDVNNDGAGIFATHNTFEPLMINSDNATAAGTLEQSTWKWTQ